MRSKIKPITINGVTIGPGEKRTVMIPMPNLYDCTPLNMPVHVIRGKTPGPTLCVSAAIHGDEVNGIEVVRRLLKKRILKKMSGTLIAIPIVNVYGFLYKDRYLMDRRDLNRVFPGKEKGSLASRLAYTITNEIISKATHCIDLHAGSLHRTNLPQIRADLSIPENEALAQAFGAPVILDAPQREGSLRHYAYKKKIPFLLYEAGEALRFDEISIRAGVSGILRIMNQLDMIHVEKPKSIKIRPTVAHASYWVRAPHSGLIHSHKTLGKSVRRGDLLATIGDPTNTQEFPLHAPIDGIIIGKNNHPVIHEGAALYHIACITQPKLMADQIECLQDSFMESPDSLDYT